MVYGSILLEQQPGQRHAQAGEAEIEQGFAGEEEGEGGHGFTAGAHRCLIGIGCVPVHIQCEPGLRLLRAVGCLRIRGSRRVLRTRSASPHRSK